MKKKLISLLAVCSLLAGMVSGCGGSKSSDASASAATTAAAKTAVATTAAAAGAGSQAESKAAPAASAAESNSAPASGETIKSAFMIPGTLSDNPIFQMFVNGITDGAKQLGYPEPKVVEGGDDWDAYSKNMITLSESGQYNLIVTCTESMCESVLDCAKKYPKIHYILLNGSLGDYTDTVPANAFAVRIKNEDLGYLGGYFCGLVTTSKELKNANPDLKVGLMFPDVYDPWEKQTKPAFINGAHAVNPDIQVTDAVVGSWVDAVKGAEVARSEYSQGVDIIWYTSGASTYGAVNEAATEGKYAVPSDNNSISNNPDVILGCTTIEGYEYAKNAFLKAADGKLEYGKATAAGADQGVVSFTFDDANYKANVPQDIQDKMKAVYQDLAAGKIDPYGKS